MDRILAAQPLKVPVMLVHGLWDQEDIYGAPAVYQAIEPKDTANDKVFLVMGPWNHGQQIHEGSSLGALRFGSDTALTFRREMLPPFLGAAPEGRRAQGGHRAGRRLRDGHEHVAAAARLARGLRERLHGQADAAPPAAGPEARLRGAGGGRRRVRGVRLRSRPGRCRSARARSSPSGTTTALTWPQWLVDDQREASGRTDVVTFVSDVLTAPVKISGAPVVNLVASTSGTDSDWVVKLIDRYPDQVARDPEMGGYQLMVSADIFRGRYRESFETAKAITANEPLTYKWTLPTANHVFLPGHRIMVQVQSSWFPLYDRNPQTFVPEHLLGEAGGLPEGDAAHPPRAGTGQLHRAAAGGGR